jgi:hypothetical protein
MTYTKAQNLLINSTSQYRSTNYGKHPIDVFNIDEAVLNNKTYNNIMNSLNMLETNYNNTLEELDSLISEAQINYNNIKQQILLLDLLPTYTYSIPDKQDYIDLINEINTLVEECNKILSSILLDTLDSVAVYTSQLIINEVGTGINSIVNKQWLSNYFNSISLIPKIKPSSAALICNSSGEIQWQQ